MVTGLSTTVSKPFLASVMQLFHGNPDLAPPRRGAAGILNQEESLVISKGH